MCVCVCVCVCVWNICENHIKPQVKTSSVHNYDLYFILFLPQHRELFYSRLLLFAFLIYIYIYIYI